MFGLSTKASVSNELINKRKLIFAPMLLILIGLLFVSFAGFGASRYLFYAQMEQYGINLAHQITDQIKGNNASLRLIEQITESQLRSINNLVAEEITSLTTERLGIIIEQTLVDEITVFDKEGRVLFFSGEGIASDITTGSILYNFLKSDELEIMEPPRTDIITGANLKYGTSRTQTGFLVQSGISVESIAELTREFSYQNFLSRLVQSTELIYAKIVDKDFKVIASSELSVIGSTLPVSEGITIRNVLEGQSYVKEIHHLRHNTRLLNVIVPIENNNTSELVLSLGISTQKMYQLQRQLLAFFVVALVVILLMVFWLQNRNVIAPVKEMDASIKEIDIENKRELRLKVSEENPFKGLVNTINTILDKTELYFLSLSNKQLDLENAVAELQESEKRYRRLFTNKEEELIEVVEELISKEKLASLGALVAGVAHEINTPLGVAISATSLIQSLNQKCLDSISTGTLTKDDLVDYINSLDESVSIMDSNLNRAAELVKSFKSIAVGQTSEEISKFNLKEVVEDLLLSLKHKLKTKGVLVNLKCPDQLKITSFPGAISQIIANLIMNSIIHGFEDMDKGVISIDIESRKDFVRIKYSDNGKGMDKTTKEKIYEPFYTNKKDKGGTGLGMSIVRNIVVNQLDGRIVLNTEIGEGVQFTIDIKA